MTDPSRRSPRAFRVTAAAAAVSVTALFAGAGPAYATGGGGPGAAGSTSTVPTQASLQVQAQELAAQIQADGRQLDKMAEAYNAAQIRSSQLASQIAELQAQSALTSAAAAAARDALKEQAVLSYLVGGSPVVGSVPGMGQNRSIAFSYAEIVSTGQKRAVDAYRRAIAAQVAQAQQLTSAEHDASVTLATLASDRAAAVQADSARQQALAQVNGQLAVLVAQVQAQQQAAAKAAALAAEARKAAPTTTPKTQPPVTTPTPAPATSQVVRTTTTSPSAAGAPSSGGSAPGSGTPAPTGSLTQAPGANKAISYAQAQIGKPYQWAGAGPNSFDCSGLTMMAWEQAGIYFPHLAQDQYNLTQRIPLASAIPGDLIFFGTPDNVDHVGIYIGNGQMIDAPQTGENVSVSSIYWTDLLGAGRVTSSS